MLKIVGALIIILASAQAGRYLANLLERRCRVLKDLQQGLLALEREISYARTPLPQALSVAAQAAGSGGPLFKLAGQKLSTRDGLGAQEAWRESLEELTCELGLKEAELEALLGFANGLGLSHSEDQLKRIELCRQRLAGLAEEAGEDKNKFAKVWKNLGWMAGLAIVLILF